MIKLFSKKNYILLLGLLLFLILGFYAFINAGYYLIIRDEIKKADAIVVLMGSPGDRMLEVVDLYFAGYSKKIIIAEDNDSGSKVLKSRGVILQNSAEKNKSVALALGIPDSSIIIVPGNANSTIDESSIIMNYINNKPQVKSILLVSSSYHMRRANMIFKKTFSSCNHNIRIICVPSSYSEFNPKNWYSHRESRKKVVMEYVKLVNYLFLD